MSDEEAHPKLKLLAIMLVVILLLVGIAVVVASTFLNLESSPSTVTVTSASGSVGLVPNATSLFSGQTLQLIATVSGTGFSKQNVQMNFYENGSLIGTVTTDSGGVAVFNRVVSAGTWVYKANCTVTVP